LAALARAYDQAGDPAAAQSSREQARAMVDVLGESLSEPSAREVFVEVGRAVIGNS